MEGRDPLARFAQQFTAGTVLFQEGDHGDEMYVVQSGRVRLTRRLRGEPQLLAVLPAGEFFGEMAIVNNRPRSATAEVIEDAQLLVLDAHMFEALVRGNAEIALRLIKRLAARLDQANSQVEVLLVRDANHRLVRQLRILADSSGTPDGPGVRVDVTDAELASLTNLSIDEVAVCLERLQRARLVWREDRSLFVPQPDSLGEFLEFLDLKERHSG